MVKKRGCGGAPGVATHELPRTQPHCVLWPSRYDTLSELKQALQHTWSKCSLGTVPQFDSCASSGHAPAHGGAGRLGVGSVLYEYQTGALSSEMCPVTASGARSGLDLATSRATHTDSTRPLTMTIDPFRCRLWPQGERRRRRAGPSWSAL